MLRGIPVVPALVLLAAGFGFPLQAAEANAPLDAWLSAQAHLRTWTADLVQTRTLKAFSQPLISTGRVWVVIPDRFRWELGQPPQTIALRQPDQLQVIYPRLRRVETYPLGDAETGPWRNALALLEAGFPRSRADLEQQFKVLAVTPTPHAIVEVTLQPRNADARRWIPAIRISLRQSDYALTATEMELADGSTLRNDFFNAAVNPVIPEDTLTIPLQPDWKVVKPARR